MTSVSRSNPEDGARGGTGSGDKAEPGDGATRPAPRTRSTGSARPAAKAATAGRTTARGTTRPKPATAADASAAAPDAGTADASASETPAPRKPRAPRKPAATGATGATTGATTSKRTAASKEASAKSAAARGGAAKSTRSAASSAAAGSTTSAGSRTRAASTETKRRQRVAAALTTETTAAERAPRHEPEAPAAVVPEAAAAAETAFIAAAATAPVEADAPAEVAAPVEVETPAEAVEPETPAESEAPAEPETPAEPEASVESAEPEASVEPEASAAPAAEPAALAEAEPHAEPDAAAAAAAAAVVVTTPRAPKPRKPRTLRVARAAPAADAPTVLEVAGLEKRFGANTAVDHVSLDVKAGSFFGIVGPNGAGKTTTLSMITGLLRPDAGTVRIHGIDVWADPVAAKHATGVLPDRLRLFDRLTGAQLLYYSGILRGLDSRTVRERSADLVQAFGLEDAIDRLVADYSAGMTKKIALACAMIHSPRLLVLDEPFESVDPVSAANLTEILERYVAGGGTVLLSSHGMDLIERVCDSVAIVVAGRILASGTLDEVRLGQTLEDRFVELAGGRKAAEGMEWLHSFSD
ncbi:ATP-binding cassette domain-containing protein [Agromyces sp. MMS24-K17]|uniref:ABC transporter ATP-binding protein n=1 Tax=Agromyces sp. MMS24-K17 TaxID=3372850 RepID=UPI003754961B